MENLDLLDDKTFNPRVLDNNKDIADANKIRTSINESNVAIRNGIYTFFGLILLQVLGGFIGYSQKVAGVYEILIEVGFMILMYVIAFFWARKKPGAGLVFGLIIYILYLLLNIAVDPSQLYKGFIIKGAIFYLLGVGIYHSSKIKDKIEQLKSISLSEEEMTMINKYQELPKIHYIKNK